MNYVFLQISFIAEAMNSRDWYEVIGFCQISSSIKQPCSSVCLRKALKIHQSCWNNAVPLLNKAENRIFWSTVQQAFKISSLAQILPASLPAVKPSSIRSRPPDFSWVMYNHVSLIFLSCGVGKVLSWCYNQKPFTAYQHFDHTFFSKLCAFLVE